MGEKSHIPCSNFRLTLRMYHQCTLILERRIRKISSVLQNHNHQKKILITKILKKVIKKITIFFLSDRLWISIIYYTHSQNKEHISIAFSSTIQASLLCTPLYGASVHFVTSTVEKNYLRSFLRRTWTWGCRHSWLTCRPSGFLSRCPKTARILDR